MMFKYTFGDDIQINNLLSTIILISHWGSGDHRVDKNCCFPNHEFLRTVNIIYDL
jgi:hypothetical protein